MNADYFEEFNWQQQAKALFFIDHLGISQIADIVQRSRETVSRFINALEGYDAEMDFRKKTSAARRKDYQKQWDRDNRGRYSMVTEETMRREQELAALLLSHERY